jgi:RNA polymerase-binding transcription factor DksA
MDNIEKTLQTRLRRKREILEEGGQQSLSHSDEDLLRIERAIDRLRTGSYGCCIDCGCEIPKERLEAIPEAERCTLHQEEFEKKLN